MEQKGSERSEERRVGGGDEAEGALPPGWGRGAGGCCTVKPPTSTIKRRLRPRAFTLKGFVCIQGCDKGLHWMLGNGVGFWFPSFLGHVWSNEFSSALGGRGSRGFPLRLAAAIIVPLCLQTDPPGAAKQGLSTGLLI